MVKLRVNLALLRRQAQNHNFYRFYVEDYSKDQQTKDTDLCMTNAKVQLNNWLPSTTVH